MYVSVQPKYPVDAKSFSLTCGDAQDKDDWRLVIKGAIS